MSTAKLIAISLFLGIFSRRVAAVCTLIRSSTLKRTFANGSETLHHCLQATVQSCLKLSIEHSAQYHYRLQCLLLTVCSNDTYS